MANYSDIKGFTVQTLSSDPAASVASTGSWASGGNLNEGVVGNAGFGTYTAAVSVGGTQPPITAQVEEYDGSSWTTVTSIPGTTSDSMGSCGPQTNGMVFGGQSGPGSNINSTFEYDGTNWTSGGNLNTTRRDLIGAGTQTEGLAAFGAIDPPFTAEAELYNGSSWTTTTEGNTAARSRAGGGTQTSAMAYGGYTGSPAYTANAETWNGSAWTEVSNLSDLKGILGGGGASNTDQLAFGGYGGSPESARFATTEHWNGSAWTELNDLSVARSTKHSLPSAPTANQLYAGGHTPPANYVTITEEWSTTPASEFSKQVEGQLYFNSTANAFKETITDVPGGTWASGTNLNTARDSSTGVGTATANLVSGGNSPSNNYYAIVEQWDGSSWTEKNDLNVGRRYAQGNGSSTSALFVGGVIPPGNTDVASNEQWDGSSWTETGDLNTARRAGFSSQKGTVTATIVASGNHPATTNTESWDGSSWTEVNNVNTGREAGSDIGIQTSAIFAGGAGNLTNNEIWDGSSWTESTEINTGRYYVGSGGNNNILGFIAGGDASGVQTKTEVWNGTSWTEVNDMATGRYMAGQTGGSASSGIFAGGNNGSAAVATVEEWTADLANKTITAS
jgi:hypothetical protein